MSDQTPPVKDDDTTDTGSARPTGEPRPSRKSRTPRETPSPSSGGEGKSSRRSSPRASNRERIRAGLIETYVGVGGGLSMFGMIRGDAGVLASSKAILENAEHAADAWLSLADQNPAVMRALSTFVEGSAVAALVIAHAPMVMPLLISRGLMGAQAAEAQAAQVQADMFAFATAAADANGAATEGDPTP